MARAKLGDLVGRADTDNGSAGPVTAPAKAAPAPQKPAPRSRQKVSFYQEPADTSRMRGALLHTMAAEGTRSLSQFIHTAVMREVERLEAKYNDGQPFPPVGSREIPQGRPLGG